MYRCERTTEVKKLQGESKRLQGEVKGLQGEAKGLQGEALYNLCIMNNVLYNLFM